MRVLIAEDDRIARRSLEATLVKWGHEVVACADGAEAWEALQSEDAPRLAILDWTMPELEGPEVCRKVRELPHAGLSYLILLTGRNQQEDLIAGIEAGADDYVAKPFDPRELQARVQAGLRIVRLQEQLLAAEQERVLTQTAGAAAHEINQPLAVLIGLSQLMLMKVGSDNALRPDIEGVHEAGQAIREIVDRIASAQKYVTKSYVGDAHIVDFQAAAQVGKEVE
jgi:CheY-like chemotaxis protein